MSKRSRRSSGAGGGLLSKQNLIKVGFAAAVTIFVFHKLQKSAGDASAKGSITNKVAGALGFSGAGIEA